MRIYVLITVVLVPSIPCFNSTTAVQTRVKRQLPCSESESRCGNGECVHKYSICDGQEDCMDGSDESRDACYKLFNGKNRCTRGQWQCAYGACLVQSKRCDGHQDCIDASDEAGCILPTDSVIASTIAERPLSTYYVATPPPDIHITGQTSSSTSLCKSDQLPCASGQCVSSYSVCDGRVDCADGSDETKAACYKLFHGMNRCTRGQFQCVYGACLVQYKRCDGHQDCRDGSDETNCPVTTRKPFLKPTTVKPPSISNLRPSTVVIMGTSCLAPEKETHIRLTQKTPRCSLSRGCTLDPGVAVNGGTTVIADCDPGFTRQASPTSDYLVTCNNGKWSPEIRPYLCYQCGISDLIVEDGVKITQTTAIANGTISKLGNFPWHAGVYVKDNFKNWQLNCGGTLISRRFVLTAAHCLINYNTTDQLKLTPFEAHEIQVTLGKIKSDWFEVENNAALWREVERVIVNNYYRGSTTLYTNDIGLVKFKKDIIFSGGVVKPACLDLNSVYESRLLERNYLGYIAGWGTERTKECQAPCVQVEDTLLFTTSEIVPYDECYKIIQKTSSKLLSPVGLGQFCAGNGKESPIESGDSGGGMTFVIDGQHFVYGVVSYNRNIRISGSTDNTPSRFVSYGIFTNVTYFKDWLEKELSS